MLMQVGIPRGNLLYNQDIFWMYFWLIFIVHQTAQRVHQVGH